MARSKTTIMTKQQLRVLVVEDEHLIAWLFADLLCELGHTAVALAHRFDDALRRAETAEIDFAILDINLNGTRSFPVADILAKRSVPFAFATGYGEAGLVEPHLQRPTILKPFDVESLRQAIARAFG